MKTSNKSSIGCGGCLGWTTLAFLGVVAFIIYASQRQRELVNKSQPTTQLQQETDHSREILSGSVSVIRTQLVPFRSEATPRMLQKAMVTWKNTGNTPVRGIEAVVTFRDKDGRVIEETDHFIFAVNDSDPGVAPGKTHKSTKDQGILFVDPFKTAASVDVSITKVYERFNDESE